MQKHFNKKNLIYAGVALGAAITAGSLLYNICKRARKRKTNLPKYLKKKPLEFISDPLKTTNVDLNIQEAELRGSLISDTKYLLGLHLKKNDEGIEGYIRIEFSLSKKSNGIFLDYEGDYVKWVSMNGKWISPGQIFARKRIAIVMEHQKIGENCVEIYYKTGYSKDGQGLHYFKDTTDGHEYLYSQFESFFAHRMFPCFDQPDLKATLTLVILSTKEWEIIANENATKIMETDQPLSDIGSVLSGAGIPVELLDSLGDIPNSGFTLRVFKETPRISTYLFGLIAGTYSSFSNKTPGYPPMRIFCRRSLVPYVEGYTKEFFHLTEKGMDYYQEYFGFKEFHFSKYDQIYCPEFNCGAMENVGCITFSEERFIWQSPPTELERNALAIVILHELSHMWFGNMVTMKWWNDLWLKESFATLMSHLCLEEAAGLEEYTKSWVVFHRFQQKGYTQDELPTTHCVSSNCQNTEEGEAAFDGITYAKGSSLLRQLIYLIGNDIFKLGVQNYFVRHAWGNTVLTDFINALQDAVDHNHLNINLTEWSDVWLNTSGLNELRPVYHNYEGINMNMNMNIEKFHIQQKCCDFGDSNMCRMHKMDVALYSQDIAQPPQIVQGVDILGEEFTNLKELKGKKAPAMVLLNSGGYSFAKIKTDEKSLEFMKQNIMSIKDDLDRLQCWKILRDMVNDAELSAPEFIEMLSKAITLEKDSDCLLTNIQYITERGMSYIPGDSQEKYMHMLFTHLLTRLTQEHNPNTQKVLLQELPSFIHTPADLHTMKDWLEHSTSNHIFKIPVDPVVRDKVLVAIWASSSVDPQDKEVILNQQLGADKSYEATVCRKQCFAAAPLWENKEKLWGWFVDEESTSSNKMRLAAMKVFWQAGQAELLLPYVHKYFEHVINVYANINRLYAELFATYLCPVIYTEEILEKYEDLYELVPENELTFKVLVEKHIIQIQRGINATKLSIKYLNSKHINN